ncbi:MAG: Lar family restriction alleviation protein [Pyramidobacter sp.]|nr:Lar family restriction alleviation protein [Pyramidobacter sp.]MBQ8129432.1 Lar family restriction alleviation protein [Clostridia bacterium]MBR1895988.1 Lar family restriction alleviation protein [Pyramidobacter sp.]
MSDKLKPCPFCGGNKIVIKRIHNSPWQKIHFFECDSCGAVVSFRGPNVLHPEPESVFSAWNRRAEVKDDD